MCQRLSCEAKDYNLFWFYKPHQLIFKLNRYIKIISIYLFLPKSIRIALNCLYADFRRHSLICGRTAEFRIRNYTHFCYSQLGVHSMYDGRKVEKR